MHPRKGHRTKAEQKRRDTLAKKLKTLRERINSGRNRVQTSELKFVPNLFPCRSCWNLIPADKLKYRVCIGCRMGKEDAADALVERLTAAGIKDDSRLTEIAFKLIMEG